MTVDPVWGWVALLALRPLALVAYAIWALRSPDDAGAARPRPQLAA